MFDILTLTRFESAAESERALHTEIDLHAIELKTTKRSSIVFDIIALAHNNSFIDGRYIFWDLSGKLKFWTVI